MQEYIIILQINLGEGEILSTCSGENTTQMLTYPIFKLVVRVRRHPSMTGVWQIPSRGMVKVPTSLIQAGRGSSSNINIGHRVSGGTGLYVEIEMTWNEQLPEYAIVSKLCYSLHCTILGIPCGKSI